ncbi:MAG: tRNA 4-thiouridine(8) synthase ThiI [Clostridiales Family XIII bacterium]|jgi:thiamine biosynthesis protein ThiI|nr:tRNA 4-thiouridine(8) synthase ThiI [Clostridiales Family XIII bacterium]
MIINDILIVRHGEVALKGINKPYFEKALLRRINSEAEKIGATGAPDFKAERSDGLVIVRGYAPELRETLAKRILKIFGVATVSYAWELCSREMDDIREAAVLWIRRIVEGRGMDCGSGPAMTSFKIAGKRSDKSYPVTSPEMSADVGGFVLEALGERVRVDVVNPDVKLYIHLRMNAVLIYDNSLEGFGGLPLGTNGKGLVLLSGGIDSPVASWMMAKRGMLIEAVHFHSYPYTSKRAEEKVMELAGIVASYVGKINVHIFNLLPMQEAIAANCPEDEMTLLVRRAMMKIATIVGEQVSANVLITGENLGQVASQTAEALVVTDDATTFPVMRPLIAMDKVDIMDKAQEIGTYETSIQPYEDCCTVFLPKHPRTRPHLENILRSEAQIENYEEIIKEIMAGEVIQIAKPE